MPLESPELAELRAFRDRRRSDAELCGAYVACKRELVAAGVVESVEYAGAKGEFIRRALGPAPP